MRQNRQLSTFQSINRSQSVNFHWSPEQESLF